MYIVVLGFYFRDNLGDDSFIDAFRAIFNNTIQAPFKLSFHNTDDIDVLPKDTSIVICGAGDIINDYFINKIGKILENSPFYKGPIYAVGVGVTDHNLVKYGHIDMFDHVVLRSETDYNIVASRLGPIHVSVLPDITCYLKPKPIDKLVYEKKKVGVFLARPICDNLEGYQNMVKSIAASIDYMVKTYNVEVHLVPFNTRDNNPREDDRIINSDVTFYSSNKLFIFNFEKLNYTEMQAYIQSLDAAICMRFHSHVFCIANNVPFVSIDCAPKVHKLCYEMGYQDFVYTLERSPVACYPEGINTLVLNSKIDTLFNNIDKARDIIKVYSEKYHQQAQGYELVLGKLLDVRPIKMDSESKKRRLDPSINQTEPKKRTTSPYPVYPSQKRQQRLDTATVMVNAILKTCIDVIVIRLIDTNLLSEQLADGKINPLFILKSLKNNFYQDTQLLDKLSSLLTRIICFSVTKQSFPNYSYGLKQQVLAATYNFYDSWDWLTKDWCLKNNKPQMMPQLFSNLYFNMTALEQSDFGGVHRSGWKYVCDYLSQYHRDLPNDVILDTYMDKTFGWYSEFYQTMGILPFKKPWVGFIHHTFAPSGYDDNSAKNIIYNQNFIDSLPTCKGIFVLTNDLKMKMELELLKLIIDRELPITYPIPKINILAHPTEIPGDNTKFDIQKFLNNPEKKVIQIGGWLRDSYAIYRLPIDSLTYNNPLGIQKAVLKGKSMENYFRPKKTLVYMTHNLENHTTSTKMTYCPCRCTCRNKQETDTCPCDRESFPNKYNIGLLKTIEDNHQSVKLLERLDNDAYDELLTKNIVFINLVDASAANTIIECMVRRVPIVVNKISPVVEYLGEEYPLYYESFREAADKCTNPELINVAHEYLKNLDKSFLTIEYFIQSMFQSDICKSLIHNNNKHT